MNQRPSIGNYGRGIPQCDMVYGPSGDYATVACVRMAGHKGPHLDYWAWERIPPRFYRKRHPRMAGK